MFISQPLGNEREVLRKCIAGEASLYLSEEILREVEKVLEYPKFNFTQTEKDSFKLIISEIGTLIFAPKRLNLFAANPSDNKSLEAALASEAESLITGDKHLLRIKQIGKTKILNASEFLKLL